jgi:hypothetical protein
MKHEEVKGAWADRLFFPKKASWLHVFTVNRWDDRRAASSLVQPKELTMKTEEVKGGSWANRLFFPKKASRLHDFMVNLWDNPFPKLDRRIDVNC